ncbi:MAG: sigma-70 family RNA polymerase sigma factor [Gemmataceae bacterium]
MVGTASNETNSDDKLSKALAAELVAIQPVLMTYVLRLVPSIHDAEELLQNTNRVLLEKANEAENVDSLIGWACRIAYYEVLAWRKNNSRDRHQFSDKTIEILAQAELLSSSQESDKLKALSDCQKQLTSEQQNLLRDRYTENLSSKQIATKTNKSAENVRQSLCRIRSALRRCIDARLRLE